jgi:two-component system, LuxR family, response regulator FixJ
MNSYNLILCDRDVRRRAAISHFLSGLAIHAEPFENPVEVNGQWARADMVLIHDEHSGVADVIDQFVQSGLFLPVIAYREAPTPHAVARAVHAGALDYLAWPWDRAELLATLDRASEQGADYCHAKRRETQARRQVERLTKREREVLVGVAEGLSNRTIGERLDISPRTVEIHRANMLSKMGADHTSEAIRIAIQAALIS